MFLIIEAVPKLQFLRQRTYISAEVSKMKQPIEDMEGLERIRDVAKYLYESMPSLSVFPQESLEGIARFVVFQRLVKKLDFEVSVAGVNCAAEAVQFLENKGRKGSLGTQKTYMRELRKLNDYCRKMKMRLLEFTPRDADNYIIYLIGCGYSSASIALAVSAVSSFCNFIERRHSDGFGFHFTNPFRGSRVKPKLEASRSTVVPTEKEVQYILKRLPPRQAAMVAVMSGLGLRSGALATLTLKGNAFTCYSKGKTVTGVMTDDLIAFLRCRVRLNQLFIGMSVGAIQRSIHYHMGRLYQKGEVRAHYSCHDFRHYFALREYGKDKDIWRVSKLLNHNSLVSTEVYLKGFEGVKNNLSDNITTLFK
jgi:site-specific recombinase XerC